MKTVEIKLGGDTFKVAAMNLGQLEQALPIIQSLQADEGVGQFGKLMDIMQIALSEAYPDVNVRKLHSNLAGLRAAFNTVMEISDFEAKVTAPGEARARARKSTSRKSGAV